MKVVTPQTADAAKAVQQLQDRVQFSSVDTKVAIDGVIAHRK